jgi:hypothetical protein
VEFVKGRSDVVTSFEIWEDNASQRVLDVLKTGDGGGR